MVGYLTDHRNCPNLRSNYLDSARDRIRVLKGERFAIQR
jgi:hypothetical protein